MMAYLIALIPAMALTALITQCVTGLSNSAVALYVIAAGVTLGYVTVRKSLR